MEGEQRGRKIMKYLMKNYSEKDTDEIICSGLAAEFGLSEEEALKYLNDFRE